MNSSVHSKHKNIRLEFQNTLFQRINCLIHPKPTKPESPEAQQRAAIFEHNRTCVREITQTLDASGKEWTDPNWKGTLKDPSKCSDVSYLLAGEYAGLFAKFEVKGGATFSIEEDVL